MTQPKRVRLVLTWAFTVLLFLFFVVNVGAQQINVTARVPDVQAPSVPILIAPEDGAIISDSTPSFQWYASSDNNGLSHYLLYLNNNLLFDQIPLVAVENSNYKLEYDHLNSIYTLTVKKSLSDRNYQWKIVAVDYANLKASSDVWDFTIDTLAPSFVLTKIGDTGVRISASDVGTVPSEPVIIFKNDASANEPSLIASGEANSQVKLTVSIPNDLTQTFNTKIDKNGVYEIKLGLLPRNVDIRLDFIITDQVNHVSVLEKVYFRIALQYWPTTISPDQGSLTPTSSLTPPPTLSVTPSISLSATPSSSLTPKPSLSAVPSLQPSGIIPILPPKEIVHELSDELIEFLPSDAALKIKNFLRSQAWLNLTPVLALLIFFAAYFLAFLFLLSKFWSILSWVLGRKLMILMFPFISLAKKNLVFEYAQTTSSPLSLVNLLDEQGKIIDFAITNLQGNFDDFTTLPKQWSLRVQDANFYFPIGEAKPEQLSFWQFYQGQAFNQENYHSQAILIPTLRAAGQKQLPWLEQVRIGLLYLLNYPWWFLGLLFIFNLLFSLRYPSLANYFVLLFYLFVVGCKIWNQRKNSLTLFVEVAIEAQLNFNHNLVFSLSQENDRVAQSLILPFAFSKSAAIRHQINRGKITIFAKNLALLADRKLVATQAFISQQSPQTLSLVLQKTKANK